MMTPVPGPTSSGTRLTHSVATTDHTPSPSEIRAWRDRNTRVLREVELNRERWHASSERARRSLQELERISAPRRGVLRRLADRLL